MILFDSIHKKQIKTSRVDKILGEFAATLKEENILLQICARVMGEVINFNKTVNEQFEDYLAGKNSFWEVTESINQYETAFLKENRRLNNETGLIDVFQEQNFQTFNFVPVSEEEKTFQTINFSKKPRTNRNKNQSSINNKGKILFFYL